MAGRLDSIRRWLNRDDGDVVPAGSRPLGLVEAAALCALPAVILLWQFHEKAGLDIAWVWAAIITGLVVAAAYLLAELRTGSR